MNLAEALPAEQRRVREVLGHYQETQRLCPQANCHFAIAMIKASLERAERAASAGDVIEMMRAYEDLKATE